MLPSRKEAEELLFTHVTDTYQRHHALMVGVNLEEHIANLCLFFKEARM